jgi:hypothetical protein
MYFSKRENNGKKATWLSHLAYLAMFGAIELLELPKLEEF